ncbi:MAG: Stf0 family sulfotransferase [Bacteroidota bacterium]
MKSPKQSYRIWHSARVGSSLLCQLLEDTGVAGMPGEHFVKPSELDFADPNGNKTYAAYRNKFWELTTGGQAVAGLKKGAHTAYDQVHLEELFTLKGIPKESDPDSIWQDLLPNCKHIILIRNNKIRQAVSWWKAIQDDVWHLRGKENYTKSKDFYEDKYDAAALRHLYHEAVLREAAAQDYLAQRGLSALTIAYEDLIAHPKLVLQRVLDYIGIDYSVKGDLKFFYQKTADELNEEWTQRFRADLQKGFEQKAW